MLRLNLGAGDKLWPNAVNLDAETDLKNLPYKTNHVDEIYAIHLFEHFHRLEAQDYLQEWWRVLKKNGKLVLEMPCLDKIATLLANNERNLRMTLFGLYGDPSEESDLMGHRWCYSKDEITKMLEKGFHVEHAPQIYHHEQRDMRVIARKL